MYISLEQHKLRIIDKMEKVRELQHIYIELKWMACTRTSRWLLLLILFRTFARQWSGTKVVGNCTRHCGAFTATSNGPHDSKPHGFEKCPIYNNDDVTPRAGNEDVSFSTDQVKDNHIVTHKDMVADE
ncbi:hypothetical protein Tco_1453744, partial [Tanacetum coccineum]